MRAIRWVATALLPLLLVFGAGQAAAQGGDQAQTEGQAEVFTLPAGGVATITFQAFCTEFGVDFPENVQAPGALADDNIRNALAYIQQEGLAETNAEEAQYAIWQLSGAADAPQGTQVAADVVTAASTAVVEPENATSLLDAVQSGQITVTVESWQPLGEQIQIGSITDNFYGEGTLRVENTSDQELTLYHPVGVTFAPGQEGEQTMAGFATQVEVDQAQGGAAGQQATATTATETATATTATETATATTAATETATATTATETATATTGTTGATNNVTSTDTTTNTAQTPAALPQTGAGDDPVAAMLLLAFAALILGGSLAMRRR